MVAEVKDKLAEKGIGMTNLLLAILILLGGLFGTVTTDSMNRMNDNVDKANVSLVKLQLTSEINNNEISHIRKALDEHGKRLNELEGR